MSRTAGRSSGGSGRRGRGAGRPEAGYFNRHTASEWLRAKLNELDDAAAAGADLSVTFAEAASEWFRYVEEDRAVQATTLRDYRSGLEHHLLPEFGDRRSSPSRHPTSSAGARRSTSRREQGTSS